jgi:hypothetical protein
MARYWVFVTFVATLLMTGLASMTEDREPAAARLAAPPQALPTPATSNGATAGQPLDDASSRRLYERRNQRSQAADTSQIQTGSLMLHMGGTEAASSAIGSALGPSMQIPIPVSYSPDLKEASPRRGQAGWETGVDQRVKSSRKPLPNSAKRVSPQAAKVLASVPSESASDAADAAPMLPTGRQQVPSDARLPEAKHVRPSGGHAQPHAPRKSGASRHGTNAAHQRRATARGYAARHESLWPRAQRDGS